MMPTLMQRITLVKLYYKNGRDFSATIDDYNGEGASIIDCEIRNYWFSGRLPKPRDP